ncbi:hypothetical protein LLH00_11270 [bacterium]|nr:hypothetical protein [bacterium]
MPGYIAVLLLSICLSLAGPLKAEVRGPLVVADRWPETSDALVWLRDAFRLDGVEGGSERDKAVSLFKWVRLFNRLCEGVGGMAHAYEGPWGREQFVFDLNKHLFVYGWGYCSTHSLVAEGLWQEYTGDSLAADRVVVMHENGGFHTMYRIRMEGRFGAFDARYGYYLLERDAPEARILDWEGVGDDRNVRANLGYRNRCRPFVEFPQHEFERLLWLKPKPMFQSEDAWRAAGGEPEVVFRDRQYRLGAPRHDMNFSLPRGATIERWWDNRMKKWYVPKADKDMFLPEGRFYRIGASMTGADGEKNDPNYKLMRPYMTRVPSGLGYPSYLEGDLSLGQAWGKITYRPQLWRGDLDEVKASGEGLATYASAPFIRPAADGGTGEWVLQFYSPYILVDGFVAGTLVGGKDDKVELSLQSEAASPRGPVQEAEWLPWRSLADKPGEFLVTLDRTDAAEGGSTFHGAYRYRLRLKLAAAGQASAVGLSDLRIVTFFENGIMSLPQLFEGDNRVQFKVQDAAQVKGDILVTYLWSDSLGQRTDCKRLTPEMFFQDNRALYHIETPGLVRCDGLIVSYP